MRTAVCLLLGALAGCATSNDFRGSRPPDAQDFVYSSAATEDFYAESLTNPAAVNLTPLPKGTTSVVVGYKRIYDRRADSVRIYKTEARRSGKLVTFEVTDVATGAPVLSFGRVIADVKFPSGDTNSCIKAFLCEHSSQLQCEANRTCKDQLWAIDCPIDPQTTVSVHGFIAPNTVLCQSISEVVDRFQGLVFSQE